MLSLLGHCLTLRSLRQCLNYLICIYFFVFCFVRALHLCFVTCISLVHHFDQAEISVRLLPIIIDCLVYQGLFIEIDTICLFSEEVLAILAVSDPNDH